MPESMMKTKKASMSLSRGDVSALYEFHSDWMATSRAEADGFFGCVADFGAAMMIEVDEALSWVTEWSSCVVQ